ncbi:hypothetical protein [Novimethylophilus kurashikiensis]|nr:hypothetical protein [Novimethylophilus kurashikiensis]
MNNNLTFLTYQEAIVAAKKEPGMEFVALDFNPPKPFLALYIIEVFEDEPDEVNITYEGGELFDMGGEEDFYDEHSVPAAAKKLFYIRRGDLGEDTPNILGMTSEYVLCEVLPGLTAPEDYTEEEFLAAATKAYKEFWRKA